MATFGVYTVTGEGKQSFGGNVNIIYCNTWVSVLGATQVLSNGAPKRIMHAGWWGLGYDTGVFPSSTVAILRWKYLEFESESIVFATFQGGPINCDHLYYHLAPGVTCKFFLSS